MCGWCKSGWRFETTVLGGPDGGRVKAVLHPISAEWEELYSRPSTGSVIVATRDPSAEDVWSGASGIYISQVMPDGTRRCRFGGYIEGVSGSGGGATTLAIKSIDSFLEERLIAGPADPYKLEAESHPSDPPTLTTIEIYKPTSATTVSEFYHEVSEGGTSFLAAFLVRLAQGNIEGGPIVGLRELTATYRAPYSPISSFAGTRELFYQWWDFKNIGQAIRELVEAENGIKYQIDHTHVAGTSEGNWFSLMTFSDVVGEARDYTLKSDREGWQYGLQIDASEKATRVYGVGSGEEGNTLFSIAYDADGVDNLPERQVTVAWKDQTKAGTLNSQTKGYVTDHRDPTTIPSMTIVGTPDYDSDSPGFDPQQGFPAPEICRPGDTFNVDIQYGLVTVKDEQVRNLGVAWSLKEGGPVERAIAMQPVIRANTSVRTQTPARPPAPVAPVKRTDPGKGGGGHVTVDPWPTPGKLVNVSSDSLDEISGMEYSIKNPGFVWVFNDEKTSPQVQLVSLSDGHTAASFNLTPGVSDSPVGDPEAIRMSKVSGRLVLADIGDNDWDRPTSGPDQPHLLAIPEPKGGGFKGSIAATRYPIAYPGGAKINCETLLIHPTTDVVYLITKEASRARVFSYGPLSAMHTSNNVGTLVATLNIGGISDGTHTRDGNWVLLRSSLKSETIVFKGWNWLYGGVIQTPAMSKGEAICVESNCALLVTTEGENPPIYRVLIPKTFGATCATPEGPVGGGGSTNPSATVPGQLIPMNNWKLQLPI